jgi:curved DNA-binding protein CbpA
MLYHPDRNDASRKAEYDEKFCTMNEAYTILSDSVSRQKYDEARAGKKPTSPAEVLPSSASRKPTWFPPRHNKGSNWNNSYNRFYTDTQFQHTGNSYARAFHRNTRQFGIHTDTQFHNTRNSYNTKSWRGKWQHAYTSRYNGGPDGTGQQQDGGEGGTRQQDGTSQQQDGGQGGKCQQDGGQCRENSTSSTSSTSDNEELQAPQLSGFKQSMFHQHIKFAPTRPASTSIPDGEVHRTLSSHEWAERIKQRNFTFYK